MAEKVQVIVDAKDNASGVLRGITQNMGALGAMTEQMTGSSINWGNVAQQAFRLVADAMKDAFDVSTKYAASVRDLSLASGQTAEESSRLLQVLDDFEISAGDVNTAVKALTKQGLAPTVETIAQLSDQYNALNTAEEKNQFIIENLGRGGLKWANALKEGGDSLRALNAAVDENLILTDENIQQYEEYRLTLDEWNDTIMGVKVNLVTEFMPALNDVMQLMMQSNEHISEGTTYWERSKIAVQDNWRAWGLLLGIIDPTVESLDSATISYQAWAKSLQTGNAAVQTAVTDYGKLLGLTKGLNDATREQIKMAGYQALQEKFKESGGEIDQSEAKILEQAGLSLGIFDQKAIDAANSVDALSTAMANGEMSIWSYINAINEIPTNIVTTVTLVGAESGTTTYGNNSGLPGSGRAAGGPVTMGETYLVGERGPELFTPRSNGNITPNEEINTSNNYFYGNVTFSTGDGGASFMEQR